MNRHYTVKEVALMSGLTERTIRHYIRLGILKGSKVGGIWNFTPDDVDTFFAHPSVRSSIQSKRNGVVYDFLFILMMILYNFLHASLGTYTVMMTAFILPLYFSNLSTIVNAQLNRTGFQVATAYQSELLAHRETTGSRQISTIHSIAYDVDALVVQGKTIPFHAHGTLKKGDIVQVCGPSGCGKSTFVKTLLKFRPVDQVKINGIAIADLDNFSLRSRIEYLSQNVPIFGGTLGDNLFLAGGRTEEAEVRFLNDPLLQTVFATKSFDSKILEGGANLSGGEKQKVALARSLAGHPDVLILDEVCSNIDQEAAEAIYQRLNMERDTRITIIISHDDLPPGLVNKRVHGAAMSAGSIGV